MSSRDYPAARPSGTGAPVTPRPPGERTQPIGRTICAVAGAILACAATGVLLTGSMLLGMVRASTHDGYLTSPSATFSTTGYALTTRVIRLHADTCQTGWKWPGGTIRVRVTAANPVVGIAPAAAAARYLSGVRYTTLTRLAADRGGPVTHQGSATPSRPASAGIWAARVTGSGTQTLTWTTRPGSWVIVAMNPDAAPA